MSFKILACFCFGKAQCTVAFILLRSSINAWTSSLSCSRVPIRGSRHCLEITDSSISAMLSLLAFLGV